MSVEVFYECVDCHQELFYCDSCKLYYHVTEMGFVSQHKSYCLDCKNAALKNAAITMTIRKQPMNMARLHIVRKA